MRTLTLGVLIVSGGTLAALPFRKYQSRPATSSASAQVTGPSQSALENAESTLTGDGVVAESPIDDASMLAETGALASNLPVWQPSSPAPAPPAADAPLTYDDLVLPIDPPPPIAQRFSATVPIRAQKLEEQRVAALVMPEMEQLAVSQQIELQRVADSVRERTSQPAEANAGGRLASSRDANDDQLPEVTSEQRQRHWIRQPD